jgi:hypothetical protein
MEESRLASFVPNEPIIDLTSCLTSDHEEQPNEDEDDDHMDEDVDDSAEETQHEHPESTPDTNPTTTPFGSLQNQTHDGTLGVGTVFGKTDDPGTNEEDMDISDDGLTDRPIYLHRPDSPDLLDSGHRSPVLPLGPVDTAVIMDVDLMNVDKKMGVVQRNIANDMGLKQRNVESMSIANDTNVDQNNTDSVSSESAATKNVDSLTRKKDTIVIQNSAPRETDSVSTLEETNLKMTLDQTRRNSSVTMGHDVSKTGVSSKRDTKQKNDIQPAKKLKLDSMAMQAHQSLDFLANVQNEPPQQSPVRKNSKTDIISSSTSESWRPLKLSTKTVPLLQQTSTSASERSSPRISPQDNTSRPFYPPPLQLDVLLFSPDFGYFLKSQLFSLHEWKSLLESQASGTTHKKPRLASPSRPRVCFI